MRIEPSSPSPPDYERPPASPRARFGALLPPPASGENGERAGSGDARAFGFGEFGMFGRFSPSATPFEDLQVPAASTSEPTATGQIAPPVSKPAPGGGPAPEALTPPSSGPLVQMSEAGSAKVKVIASSSQAARPSTVSLAPSRPSLSRVSAEVLGALAARASVRPAAGQAAEAVRMIEQADGRILVVVNGDVPSQSTSAQFIDLARRRLAAHGLVLDRVVWVDGRRYATSFAKQNAPGGDRSWR